MTHSDWYILFEIEGFEPWKNLPSLIKLWRFGVQKSSWFFKYFLFFFCFLTSHLLHSSSYLIKRAPNMLTNLLLKFISCPIFSYQLFKVCNQIWCCSFEMSEKDGRGGTKKEKKKPDASFLHPKLQRYHQSWLKISMKLQRFRGSNLSITNKLTEQILSVGLCSNFFANFI